MARAWSGTRRCTRKWCSSRRDEGSALHRRGSRRAVGARGAAALGSLHRRVRPREPGADAFNKKHVKLLTLLASEAAVAIENARLYERIRANEARYEKELRFAQRVQMALLPQELPKRLRGVDVAWHFDPARELGGDLCDFLSPEANTLVVAVGDVSGKGVPAALYSAAIGEMVRGRTFRRRLEKTNSTPATVLSGMNRILHERNLEEYYCTLCYAMFEFKKQIVTFANSGLPYPVKCSDGKAIESTCPACRLVLRRLAVRRLPECRWRRRLFVLCSTAFPKRSTRGQNSAPRRVIDVIERTTRPAKEIVSEYSPPSDLCGDAPQSDDRTVVVVKSISWGRDKRGPRRFQKFQGPARTASNALRMRAAPLKSSPRGSSTWWRRSGRSRRASRR